MIAVLVSGDKGVGEWTLDPTDYSLSLESFLNQFIVREATVIKGRVVDEPSGLTSSFEFAMQGEELALNPAGRKRWVANRMLWALSVADGNWVGVGAPQLKPLRGACAKHM